MTYKGLTITELKGMLNEDDRLMREANLLAETNGLSLVDFNRLEEILSHRTEILRLIVACLELELERKRG